jgi:hypothetical protein
MRCLEQFETYKAVPAVFAIMSQKKHPIQRNSSITSTAVKNAKPNPLKHLRCVPLQHLAQIVPNDEENR